MGLCVCPGAGWPNGLEVRWEYGVGGFVSVMVGRGKISRLAMEGRWAPEASLGRQIDTGPVYWMSLPWQLVRICCLGRPAHGLAPPLLRAKGRMGELGPILGSTRTCGNLNRQIPGGGEWKQGIGPPLRISTYRRGPTLCRIRLGLGISCSPPREISHRPAPV